jgi:hypothetical protein
VSHHVPAIPRAGTTLAASVYKGGTTGGDVKRYRALIGGLIAISALMVVDAAISKEIKTTTCGRNQCRTVTNGISGVATLPGRVSTPREGRFYTVSLRLQSSGWKLVYEDRRQIVRAADSRARSFLGQGWARLTVDMRPQYRNAVRELQPMRAAPQYVG